MIDHQGVIKTTYLYVIFLDDYWMTFVTVSKKYRYTDF